MPWQKNGTPNTLNVTGDTLSVDDLTEQDTSVLLCHALNSGTIDTNITFDNDTASNYTIRQSSDGGADTTAINQSNIATGGDAADGFHVYYTVNMRDHDKLLLGDKIDLSSTGAATAPSRRVQRGKWANTVDQFTSVEFSNAGAGSFIADSNLSVLSDIPTIPETIGGWVELGRTTLGSPGDIIDVTGLADKRYYMILSDLGRSGLIGLRNRVGTTTIDTGSNYAVRRSLNGTSDFTGGSLTFADISEFDDTTSDIFQVVYGANLSAKEKLVTGHNVGGSVVGAGTVPIRSEGVFKWANTSAPMQSWRAFNASTGDYTSGSEVVVLGWDPDDIHAGNFWEELDSTDFSGSAATFTSGTFTAKKYLWVQCYIEGTSSLRPFSVQFNSDTATSYSIRRSHNGAGDATFVNLTSIDGQGGGGVTNIFWNMFIINNLANEKLCNVESVSVATQGSGTATLRDEIAGKWANTASQITTITVRSGDSGNITTGNLRVWGSD